MHTNTGGTSALKTMHTSFIQIMATGMLALIISGMTGCGSRSKEQTDAQGDSHPAAHIVPVKVAVASHRDLSLIKVYSGTLEGEEQANVVAKISERITHVQIRVGQVVETGQVTIALDKSGVSSQYYQAEANFKNNEKTLQRMKSLYEEGAVSLQTVDGAQTAYDVARANFEAARGAVELTCPIAGVVTAVNVNVGDLAMPGGVLATIAQIDNMKVIFNINESDLASFSIGQPVEVYSDTRQDVKRKGHIVQLSKSADVGSRSFEVKALFSNTSDRWFKPGMFCKVSVQFALRDSSLVIPAAAIQSDGITDRVYLVHGGQSYVRKVALGLTDGTSTEVLRGLSPGDTVATLGLNNLRDSTYVKVVSQ
jgi:membrane fusion protein (multidrug efflux system)